jgi:hypothetical protein
MYFYDDGLLLKMTGALGKVSFDLSDRQGGTACRSRPPATSSRITDVALPSATFVTARRRMLVNVPFTIGATPRSSPSSPSTWATRSPCRKHRRHRRLRPGADLGRNLTGSFNPQRVTVATKNFISHWQAGTRSRSTPA